MAALQISGLSITGAGTVTGPDFTVGVGGTYQLIASSGNWNGATGKLQYKNTDGSYIDAPSAAVFTANGLATVDIGDGQTVRWAIITAVPTAIEAWLRKVSK